MAMQIQCPGCQAKFKLKKAPATAVRMKCPKCEGVIQIPAGPVSEEPAKAEPPAASPAAEAAPTAKAAKAGKATAASATGPAKKPAKKKKAPAQADALWDDDGFGDDYEDFADDDGFGDDFGDESDDDFTDARSSRSRSRSGTGKGKAGGKAGKRKGGGKNVKNGMSTPAKAGIVVLALAVIGGGVFGAMQMFGGDDSVESSETGGGDGSDAATGAGADLAGAGIDNGAPVKNVVDMRYLPAQTEVLVQVKAASLWNAPLIQKLKAQLGGSIPEDIDPNDIESAIVGGWSPEGGPPGPNAGYLAVLTMKRDVAEADFRNIDSSSDYNGTKIFKLRQAQMPAAPGMPPGMGAAPTVYMSIVESRLLLFGPEAELKGALDRGSREVRFERFDFADPSAQVMVAVAPRDPDAMASGAPPIPEPTINQLVQNLLQNARGFGLGINVGSDLQLALRVSCRDSAGAAALQKDVMAAVKLGQDQLKEMMGGNLMMGMMLKPVESIVGRANAQVSGNEVILALNATEQELATLGNTLGPFVMQGLNGGQPGVDGPPSGLGATGAGGSGGFPGAADPASSGPGGPTTGLEFQADVYPILKWRCGQCHIRKTEGGLSLASFEAIMAHEGKAGKAVVPGDPEASAIYRRTHAGEMPPKQKLRDAEVETLRKWIEAGAKPPGSEVVVSKTFSNPDPGSAAAASGTASALPSSPGGSVSFAASIEPLLKQQCGSCHIRQQKGGFSMASLQTLLQHSGKDGPAVRPGDPAGSTLYTMVSSGKMPPRGALPQEQVEAIRAWIAAGATP